MHHIWENICIKNCLYETCVVINVSCFIYCRDISRFLGREACSNNPWLWRLGSSVVLPNKRSRLRVELVYLLLDSLSWTYSFINYDFIIIFCCTVLIRRQNSSDIIVNIGCVQSINIRNGLRRTYTTYVSWKLSQTIFFFYCPFLLRLLYSIEYWSCHDSRS